MRFVDRVRALARVIRPHIVAGGFLGYLLGALLALNLGGGFNPVHFALGYAVVLAGDLSTHFSNDYFDVEIDRDSPPKAFGRSNALVEHPGTRPAALSQFPVDFVERPRTRTIAVDEHDDRAIYRLSVPFVVKLQPITLGVSAEPFANE